MMTNRNRTETKRAKSVAREVPVGLIILGVGVLYIALCLKVFAG